MTRNFDGSEPLKMHAARKCVQKYNSIQIPLLVWTDPSYEACSSYEVSHSQIRQEISPLFRTIYSSISTAGGQYP